MKFHLTINLERRQDAVIWSIRTAELAEALQRVASLLSVSADTLGFVAEDHPHGVAIRIPAGGEVAGKWWIERDGAEPCRHLADADRPLDDLNPEPCEKCGLYYVNDGD